MTPTVPLGRPTKALLLATLAIACATALGAASPALAATASSTVNAGSLQFLNGTPADVTFPATTLNGTNQTQTQTQTIDVGDASGSGAGWSITATSTNFTAAGHTMTGGTTVATAPAVACITSCTLPTNAVSYPYSLPAGATAPPATKLYNAALNTGMGSQRVTPTWSLLVPSSTWAGGAANPYTSTWTFTLVSGP